MRPTHKLADGSLVFPGGYEPEDLTLLPDGFWEAHDLAEAKARKWTAVKQWRSEILDGGFDVAGIGRFDSALESRVALLGANMGDVWTLADNSQRAFGAGEVAEVLAAMRVHERTVHARSQEIRRMIDSAETIEDVNQISF